MTDTCSLTAEELPARRDAFLALIDDALLTARVSLRRDARSEAALDALVRAESECCPFLECVSSAARRRCSWTSNIVGAVDLDRATAGDRGLGAV